MLIGFGLDVPTSSGVVQTDPSRPAQFCGSSTGMQQMLSDLGYYSGPINGDPNQATAAAIYYFAKDHGMSVASGLTKTFCLALEQEWQKVAGGTSPPPVQAVPAPVPVTTVPTTGGGLQPGQQYSPAPQSTTAPASPSSPPDYNKWMLIGAGVLGVGVIAYLMMGKR
jgi:hypothetical protein